MGASWFFPLCFRPFSNSESVLLPSMELEGANDGASSSSEVSAKARAPRQVKGGPYVHLRSAAFSTDTCSQYLSGQSIFRAQSMAGAALPMRRSERSSGVKVQSWEGLKGWHPFGKSGQKGCKSSKGYCWGQHPLLSKGRLSFQQPQCQSRVRDAVQPCPRLPQGTPGRSLCSRQRGRHPWGFASMAAKARALPLNIYRGF